MNIVAVLTPNWRPSLAYTQNTHEIDNEQSQQNVRWIAKKKSFEF